MKKWGIDEIMEFCCAFFKTKTVRDFLMVMSPVILYIFSIIMRVLYERTIAMPFLFLYTVARMIWEKPYQILFGILVYALIHIFASDVFEKKYIKMIATAYFALCFIIISGQTIRMNDDYTMNHGPLTTAHVLLYQAMDMVGKQYVVFEDEPCQVELEVETYYILGGRRGSMSIKEKREGYYYIYLENQNDMIPFPEEYASAVRSIIERSGGVCDIVCYKNTHIVKAINGVRLTSLR